MTTNNGSSNLICSTETVRDDKLENASVLNKNFSSSEKSSVFIGNRKMISVFETIINKILLLSEKKKKSYFQSEGRTMSIESLPYSQSTEFEDDIDSRVDEQSLFSTESDPEDDEDVEDISFETEICRKFTIKDFLLKLSRILGENHEDYCLFALITFDNLLKSNSQLLLNKFNIYAIITFCFSISIKANSDIYIQNYIVSGLLECEFNQTIRMEIAFLKLLEFKTVISELRFEAYKLNLFEKIGRGLL